MMPSRTIDDRAGGRSPRWASAISDRVPPSPLLSARSRNTTYLTVTMSDQRPEDQRTTPSTSAGVGCRRRAPWPPAPRGRRRAGWCRCRRRPRRCEPSVSAPKPAWCGHAMPIGRRRFRGGNCYVTCHGRAWWPLKMLHCTTAEERARLIVLRCRHSLARFWALGMQNPHGSANCVPIEGSDGDLGANFNHAAGRNLEIVGGVIGRAAERDEQVVLPERHARLRRRLRERRDTKKDVDTMSTASPTSGLRERPRHVRRLEEAVMDAHAEEALAELLDLMRSARTSGVSSARCTGSRCARAAPCCA